MFTVDIGVDNIWWRLKVATKWDVVSCNPGLCWALVRANTKLIFISGDTLCDITLDCQK